MPAAEFQQFQAYQAANPRPRATADQQDKKTPFDLKTDPRKKWPIELMGTARRTHISFQEHVAYPLTRDRLFKQHGERSMQEYLTPGYVHPPYAMAGGAAYFSTKPTEGWNIMAYGSSKPIVQ